ncbi:MAG: HAD-IA family hydrolase [Pseudomonadota bacterium]
MAGVPPRIDALAFDLDGTLIDTAPDICAALNAALVAQGLAAVALSAVRGWIGDGPDQLIERALAQQGIEMQPALHQALREGFDGATLATPMQRGGVFEGLEALLVGWQARLPMVVVTNKPTPLSRRVLEAAGLLHYFRAVFGADRPDLRKPGPALLQAAAAHLKVVPARLLMVGDSGNDLRCADAAGCPAVWVAWGYGRRDAPAGMEVLCADSPADLATHIELGRHCR